MNIYSLRDTSPLEQLGHTIDTAQRLKLQLSLLKLSQLANADQLLFWGKIFTMTTPYYIAVALDFKNYYSFPHKRFFYAAADLVFAPLPSLDAYNRGHVENGTAFTGVASTILKSSEGGEKGEKGEKGKEDGEEEEEENVEVAAKNYTEEDRLCYVVHAIETECQLVPMGAFRMNAQHEIRYNDEYIVREAKPKSFLHFRYPQTADKKKVIESAQSVFRFDIFDPIANPKNWSFQANTTNTILTARSLQWPGYLAYAVLDKNIFGGLYYGYGIKNTEVAFQL